MEYATIEAALAREGLIARGGFRPEPGDGVPELEDGALAAEGRRAPDSTGAPPRDEFPGPDGRREKFGRTESSPANV